MTPTGACGSRMFGSACRDPDQHRQVGGTDHETNMGARPVESLPVRNVSHTDEQAIVGFSDWFSGR